MPRREPPAVEGGRNVNAEWASEGDRKRIIRMLSMEAGAGHSVNNCRSYVSTS